MPHGSLIFRKFRALRTIGILQILALALTAAVWVLLIVAPLGAVLVRVSGADSWRTLWDPEILGIVRFTAYQALLSTTLAVAIGVPLGLWAGASRFARVLLSVPFGVPTVVAGTAWVLWLGRSGILAGWGVRLDWAYTLSGVVLAHVFFNAPFSALLVAHARLAVSKDHLEAAATLGAGRIGRFRFVLWPVLRWSIASAASQVFSLCVMSFALVLILGGGPPVQTLETALFARIRYGTLDLNGAVACGCWELLLTLFPWLLMLFMRRSRVQASPLRSPETRSRGTRWMGQVARVTVSFIFILPYLAVLFSGGMKPWLAFFSPTTLETIAEPLRATALLAVWSGAGTIALVLLAIFGTGALPEDSFLRRAFSVLWILPSGISILVLGLGFFLAYGRWLDPFSGSLAAIVALQIALFCPLAFRILWPAAQGDSRTLLNAAMSLGASPFRAFLTVEWPRWRGPVFSALAVVLGASLGEVAAVSLFYGEGLVPLPLLVSRWMGQYRFEDAQVLAGVLFLLATGVISVVGMLGTGKT